MVFRGLHGASSTEESQGSNFEKMKSATILFDLSSRNPSLMILVSAKRLFLIQHIRLKKLELWSCSSWSRTKSPPTFRASISKGQDVKIRWGGFFVSEFKASQRPTKNFACQFSKVFGQRGLLLLITGLLDSQLFWAYQKCSITPGQNMGITL